MIQLVKLSALAIVTAAGCLIGCGNKTTDNSHAAGTKRDSLTMAIHDFVFEDDRPFLQCHASTVLNTSDGNFLVAWFGGTHEKHDDVGIWLSKGRPGAWSVPVEIVKLRETPHWNSGVIQVAGWLDHSLF
jgi:predicted neuraminidase